MLRNSRQNVLPALSLKYCTRCFCVQSADSRRKLVVLGTGWGSINFLRHVDVKKFHVTVVSPREYFVINPLLPSVCSGTLMEKSCMNELRDILWKEETNFFAAKATDVMLEDKEVVCETKNNTFRLKYDLLVIGVGATVNTFDIPGVMKHAYFLKEAEDAMVIKRAVLSRFEQASLPGVCEEERKRLLHFVVVGGGPTGVETAAELADMFHKELKHLYSPQMLSMAKISLIEALPTILPMFSPEVQQFAIKTMQEKLSIEFLLEQQVVGLDVDGVSVVTRGDTENNARKIASNFCLWATGVQQTDFIKLLQGKVGNEGRSRGLAVNPWFEVQNTKDVFALGDCSIVIPPKVADVSTDLFQCAQKELGAGPNVKWVKGKEFQRIFPQMADLKMTKSVDESKWSKSNMSEEEFTALLETMDKNYIPPVPTAQNAAQQGRYLANLLNCTTSEQERHDADVFNEKWSGSLVYVGNHQACADFPNNKKMLGGWYSNPLWKAAYVSNHMTTKNMAINLIDWMRSSLLGRDVLAVRTPSFHNI